MGEVVGGMIDLILIVLVGAKWRGNGAATGAASRQAGI